MLETEFALALIDLRKRGHAVVAVDVLEGCPVEGEHDPLVNRMWTLQRSFMYRDMATVGVDIVGWPGTATLDQAMALAPDHRTGSRGDDEGAGEGVAAQRVRRADGGRRGAPSRRSALTVAAPRRWSRCWLRRGCGPPATVAVLLTMLTVVVADTAPMYTALAGLAATALPGAAPRWAATAPTMLAAVGFAAVGTVAVALPVQMPWLPLAAPLALLAGYLLSLRPFLAETGGR